MLVGTERMRRPPSSPAEIRVHVLQTLGLEILPALKTPGLGAPRPLRGQNSGQSFRTMTLCFTRDITPIFKLLFGY